MTTLAVRTRRSLVHSLVVAVVAAVAMALLLSSKPVRTEPAAHRVLDYTPVTGATFNRPVGPTHQQRAIIRHINRTIDATPGGATIRIAIYSFTLGATATRLIQADHRGVNVQMIFDKHRVYGPEKRLIRKLGSNPNHRSFARFCNKSCRGPRGVMHQKVFLFSKAGDAESVVMVGSNNMTLNNAENQWSDVYTVTDDDALFFTYAGVFDQMKYDQPQRSPYIEADINGYEPSFYPLLHSTRATDPLYEALSEVTCIGAADGYGVERKNAEGATERATVLRMSLHAWNGTRGRYLAQKVADLYNEGCDIEIVLGTGIGRVVKNILHNNDVPTSTGRRKHIHTHQKAMYLNGVFGDDPASTLVWTGSHNWSNGALRRDDAMLRIDTQEAYDQYLANFEDIWNHG